MKDTAERGEGGGVVGAANVGAHTKLPSSEMPADLGEALRIGLAALQLPLDQSVQSRLLAYVQLIAKWSRVYNLTAVRDPREMLTHHILDSLAVASAAVRALQEPGLASPSVNTPLSVPPLSPTVVDNVVPHLLDVGSGAGLPGLALALAFPGLGLERFRVTCVDAVSKKVGFIQQAAAELGLMASVSARHGRIESLQLPPAQLITCRAFASLADWVALTERHLAPGGMWMAMKGQVPDAEISALPSSVEVFHVEPLSVPYLDAQRCLVWIRRKHPTATGSKEAP